LRRIKMRKAYIVSAVRTPAGKAPKGTLKDTRPDELAALVIQEAVKRAGIEPAEVEDVILGCAFPEAEQGMNVARVSLLRAGLPYSVPGITINRFCASGLQAIAMGAERIMLGSCDVIVAGGTESMSLIPMGGNKLSPNPYLMENYPQVYLSMGLTAEKLAEKYNIKREEQDKFSYESHMKAHRATEEGKFSEEIIPVTTRVRRIREDGEEIIETVTLEKDEGIRPDTSLEALSQLKPVFKQDGTVTAGNSSQMSDGAAACVIMSEEKVKSLGIKPLALFKTYAVAGVPPEIMGIGPVEALPKALKLANLDLKDIGLIELNEAFAAQSLAVIKTLDLNPDIINVNGGAIALGHPLGCTGAKLTATLIYEMRRRDVKFGVVTMCIGGGMGAAAIFERI
jgi:acetyl-CoA acyltransferase